MSMVMTRIVDTKKDDILNISSIVKTLSEKLIGSFQENTFDVGEKNVFQVIFSIISDCISLVEKMQGKRKGFIKKILVIEIGEIIVRQFLNDYLSFYNENVSDMIEVLIHSYHILSKFKKSKKNRCCVPFCGSLSE